MRCTVTQFGKTKLSCHIRKVVNLGELLGAQRLPQRFPPHVFGKGLFINKRKSTGSKQCPWGGLSISKVP